jgi:hypothetical protein
MRERVKVITYNEAPKIRAHRENLKVNRNFTNYEACFTYSSVDVLRRTQYRTPVGSLENSVLCCALFTKPYHSNDGSVLLRVCVAMGMFLHNNEHLQISTVADRSSMFATYERIPWKAPINIIPAVSHNCNKSNLPYLLTKRLDYMRTL